MTEIIFIVKDALEGGFIAKSLDESIFAQADAMEELKTSIKEAVDCHFDEADMPRMIRLYQVKEELIAI